jgi:hypothetical protein
MSSKYLLGAMISACLAVGCDSSIVGEWEGKVVPAATKDSVVEIEDEGGSATLEFPEAQYTDPELGETYVIPPITGKFEVEWSDEGNDEYELDFICKSVTIPGATPQCSDTELSNFGFDCELKSSDELECKSSSPLLTDKVELERN